MIWQYLALLWIVFTIWVGVKSALKQEAVDMLITLVVCAVVAMIFIKAGTFSLIF